MITGLEYSGLLGEEDVVNTRIRTMKALDRPGKTMVIIGI